jgi:hypothetical protein
MSIDAGGSVLRFTFLPLSQYLGPEQAEATLAGALGELRGAGLSAERVASVKAIIDNMSFSKELKAMQAVAASGGGSAGGAGGGGSSGVEGAVSEEAAALARVGRELAVVQVRSRPREVAMDGGWPSSHASRCIAPSPRHTLFDNSMSRARPCGVLLSHASSHASSHALPPPPPLQP